MEAQRRPTPCVHSTRVRALVATLASLVAVCALLAQAAQAQAATVSVEFSCTGITYHYEGFPNAENNTITEKVKINGKEKYRFFHFNGPTATDFYPIAMPPGHSHVDTFVKWNTNGVKGGRDIKAKGGLTCARDPNFELEKLQRVEGSGSYTTATFPSTHVGQTVEYAIIVKNTGNVPLTLSPSDTGCEELSGGPAELQPEEQAVYKCKHVLDKADGEAGKYCNQASATAEGKTKSSNTVCVELPESSGFTQTFGCKSVTIYWYGFPNEPGNTVFYKVTSEEKTIVEGTYTFNGPSGEKTVEINLPPGHHPLDVRSSWHTNGVSGGADHKLQGGITCTSEPKASLSLEKFQQVGRSGFTMSELTSSSGETVEYEVVAKNTGEKTLMLSNFTDTKCSNISGGASSLAPEATTTWYCEHELLSGAGTYTNVASVEANEGVGKVESNTVTVNVE